MLLNSILASTLDAGIVIELINYWLSSLSFPKFTLIF